MLAQGEIEHDLTSLGSPDLGTPGTPQSWESRRIPENSSDPRICPPGASPGDSRDSADPELPGDSSGSAAVAKPQKFPPPHGLRELPLLRTSYGEFGREGG